MSAESTELEGFMDIGAHRVTFTRHMLGVRWGWWQDRKCRRHGHLLDQNVSVGVRGAGFWPICTRCGRGVKVA